RGQGRRGRRPARDREGPGGGGLRRLRHRPSLRRALRSGGQLVVTRGDDGHGPGRGHRHAPRKRQGAGGRGLQHLGRGLGVSGAVRPHHQRVVGGGEHGHASAALPAGKVLVAGGQDGTIRSSSAELYDQNVNAWSLTGAMASARAGHTATALPDGEVLVAGGSDGSQYLSSAELYDPNQPF